MTKKPSSTLLSRGRLRAMYQNICHPSVAIEAAEDFSLDINWYSSFSKYNSEPYVCSTCGNVFYSPLT